MTNGKVPAFPSSNRISIEAALGEAAAFSEGFPQSETFRRIAAELADLPQKLQRASQRYCSDAELAALREALLLLRASASPPSLSSRNLQVVTDLAAAYGQSDAGIALKAVLTLLASPPSAEPCQRCNGAGVDTYVNPHTPSGFTERPCPACHPSAETPECAHGHTSRKVGCVSCVIVFDRPAESFAAASLRRPEDERARLQRWRDDIQRWMDEGPRATRVTAEWLIERFLVEMNAALSSSRPPTEPTRCEQQYRISGQVVRCELAVGHPQNHRAPHEHGSVQWHTPKE